MVTSHDARFTRSICNDECSYGSTLFCIDDCACSSTHSIDFFRVLPQQVVASMSCVHCASWMIKITITDACFLMVDFLCMIEFYHDEVPEV